jgi:hypothetical protein
MARLCVKTSSHGRVEIGILIQLQEEKRLPWRMYSAMMPWSQYDVEMDFQLAGIKAGGVMGSVSFIRQDRRRGGEDRDSLN